jgi:general stress protein 26
MVNRLLDAADYVIAHAPHCWLTTLAQGGGVHARPMGRAVSPPSQTAWNLYFLADSRSSKVRDIRFSRQVRLAFELDGDSFVTLAGEAELVRESAVMARRWLPAYDSIFSTAEQKADAVFIDICTNELRLWIRGLTPDPFGTRSLTLRRSAGGPWQLDSDTP